MLTLKIYKIKLLTKIQKDIMSLQLILDLIKRQKQKTFHVIISQKSKQK